MDRDALLARVRARCAKHRGPTAAFCRACFLAELEDALAAEHPEMKRDYVFELIQSSARVGGRADAVG